MFVVETPLGYGAERRYILDVVLSSWFGLEWSLVQEDRADVRISVRGGSDDRCLVLPDVLFATAPQD